MSTDLPLSTNVPEQSNYPIGVIIPTYNRSSVLLQCLKHLEQQTFADFEVIVVDDGSTDATPRLFAEYQRKSPLHLRYFRQENSGPGRARNRAIAALKTPICLMIGDDIFPSPSLISTHLHLHQQKPEMEIAGLGLTRWSESGQDVTKFMRWLDDSGVQFAYAELLRGLRPDWRHFYTSNLSLKTKLLQQNPFNESFAKAAMEDMELGYRLEQQYNLKIELIPEARADHLHPTSFRQACKRMFHVGQAIEHFHNIWPDAEPPRDRSQRQRVLRNFSRKTKWLLPFLTPVADALTTVWCPNPLMRYVLFSYYAIGLKQR